MSNTKETHSSTTDKAAESPKRRDPEAPHKPTPGTILLAFTSILACWIIAGAIAYIAPSLSSKDDYTCLVVGFWPLETFATGYLVLTACNKGWQSITPIASAAIAGFSTTTVHVMCLTGWKNFATFAFWVEAGVYVSLLLEARFRMFELAEKRLGGILDL